MNALQNAKSQQGWRPKTDNGQNENKLCSKLLLTDQKSTKSGVKKIKYNARPGGCLSLGKKSDVAFPASPTAEICMCDPDSLMWGWKLWKWRHMLVLQSLWVPWHAAFQGPVGSILTLKLERLVDILCEEEQWHPKDVHARVPSTWKCALQWQSWADGTKLRIWGLRGSTGLSGWDWCNGKRGRRLTVSEDDIMEEEGKRKLWDEDKEKEKERRNVMGLNMLHYWLWRWMKRGHQQLLGAKRRQRKSFPTELSEKECNPDKTSYILFLSIW